MPLPDTFLDTFIEDMPIEEHGVILRRAGVLDSSVPARSTNVPHLVQKHSPDGYGWGYGGSGPSDLARSIIENMLRLMEHKGTLAPWRDLGEPIFMDSYMLYQDFKLQFIATVPDESIERIIPYLLIVAWINEKLA